jgi:hypothetical protein
MRFLGYMLGLVLLSFLAAPDIGEAASPKANRPSGVTIAAPGAWTGDFDMMRQRRVLRVLTPFGQTDFFFDRGRQRGVNAEFAAALEEFLNRRHAGICAFRSSWCPCPAINFSERCARGAAT